MLNSRFRLSCHCIKSEEEEWGYSDLICFPQYSVLLRAPALEPGLPRSNRYAAISTPLWPNPGLPPSSLVNRAAFCSSQGQCLARAQACSPCLALMAQPQLRSTLLILDGNANGNFRFFGLAHSCRACTRPCCVPCSLCSTTVRSNWPAASTAVPCRLLTLRSPTTHRWRWRSPGGRTSWSSAPALCPFTSAWAFLACAAIPYPSPAIP